MSDDRSERGRLLQPVAGVVQQMVQAAPELRSTDLMIVGARCRDIHHHLHGHDFPPAATHDLDLALAVPSWDVFEKVTARHPRLGHSGIRYLIADTPVDLMPFGEIENPTGLVEPPSRGEPFSVWAFSEVHRNSVGLDLDGVGEVRLPTVPGYTAIKLAAWLDRTEQHDVADLALSMFWYQRSNDVKARLYGPDDQILLDEGMHLGRATAHLLGHDVSLTIGAERQHELLARWRTVPQAAVHSFQLAAGPWWPGAKPQRIELLEAFTRGLRRPPPTHVSR